MDKNVHNGERCPTCGRLICNTDPVPEVDNGEVVCVVGNKREIAMLMDETEFEDFCRIWHETQAEYARSVTL